MCVFHSPNVLLTPTESVNSRGIREDRTNAPSGLDAPRDGSQGGLFSVSRSFQERLVLRFHPLIWKMSP